MIANLAWRATSRDLAIFLCNVSIILGVLVPLLILSGLRGGLHDALIGQLSDDANILSIHVRADQSLSAETLEQIAGWPETDFLAPRSRAVADLVEIMHPETRRVEVASLVPSGPGDPALPPDAPVVTDQTIHISEALATRLDLGPGSMAEIVVQFDARPRPLVIEVEVLTIAPADQLRGARMLATPELLDVVESYVDGYAVPQYGVEDGRDPANRIQAYEGVRLFATDLLSVGPLADRLEQLLGLETVSDADEIAARFALSAALQSLLRLISVVAFLGMTMALVFIFWNEVDRNRRDYGVLGLMGLRSRDLTLLILARALILALVAGLCALALYMGARIAINAFLPDGVFGGRPPLSLNVSRAAGLLSIAALALCISALSAVNHLRRIDPARLFRES